MSIFSQPVSRTGIKIYAQSVANSDIITIPQGFVIDYFLIKAVTTSPVGTPSISLSPVSLTFSPTTGASSTYFKKLSPIDDNAIGALASNANITVTIVNPSSGSIVYDVTVVLTRS